MTNKDNPLPPRGRTVRCASCSAPFQLPRDTLPFCSTRCKLQDLSKWFSEEYRVPIASAEGSQFDDSIDGDQLCQDADSLAEDQE
jgi:endogenous inhibitor of DNA gyrase (YacG/DUF329 family)